jgi:hypothetical protein
VTSTQDKPVLDERMFQQLLAAAYTLQEYASHPLVMEGKSDCVQTFSCRAVAECGGPTQVVAATPNTVTHGIPPLNPLVPMAPDDVEPSAPFNDSLTQQEPTDQYSAVTELGLLAQQEILPDAARRAPQLIAIAQEISAEQQQPAAHTQAPEEGALELPPAKPMHLVCSAPGCKRFREWFRLTDELFWKFSTAVAVAAVSTLLLGASVHRFSPLPAGLSLSPEEVQQQAPFQGTK